MGNKQAKQPVSTDLTEKRLFSFSIEYFS